jgi:hypothetical protein
LAKSQQIRHRADVVLVTVREHNAKNIVEPIANRAEVRKDEVNTGLVFLGEQHATVDDQDLAVDLKRGHVATYFTKTADRRYAKGLWLERWRVK